MRIPIFILPILLLISCSDERSVVITTYLEGYSRGEVNLSYHVKRVKSLDRIFAEDSLSILEASYELKKNKFFREHNELTQVSLSLKNDKAEKEWIQSIINDNQHKIEEVANLSDTLTNPDLVVRAMKGNAVALIQKQKQLIELKMIANSISKYRTNPNVLLASIFRVTYTVKYPSPIDKLEEVSKTFVLSPDETRVLKVLG